MSSRRNSISPFTVSIVSGSQAEQLAQDLRDAVERTVENVAESDKPSRRFLPKNKLSQILNHRSLQLLFMELLSGAPLPGKTERFVSRRIGATLGRPSRISILALFLYENCEELLSLYLEWLDALLDDNPADYDRVIPSDDSMPFTTKTLHFSGVPEKYHRYIFEKQAIFKPVTLRQLAHHEVKNRERLPFIGRQEPIKQSSSGDVVKVEIAQGHWEIEAYHDFVPDNPSHPKVVALKIFKHAENVRYMNEATLDFRTERIILEELRNSEIKHDTILLDLGSITLLDEGERPISHALVFDLANFNLDDFLRNQDLAQERIIQSHLLRKLVDIVQALAFLHERLDIIHLDIRPDNILIFENRVGESQYDQTWKLSNFVLARKEAATQRDTSSQTLKATLSALARPAIRPAGLYQAPEIHEHDTSQALRSADVWSMGCVTLMVLALMVEGSEAVIGLESALLVHFLDDDGRHPLFYIRSDTYNWKHRMADKYWYLTNRTPEKDFISGIGQQLQAALHPNLIEWSNMLLFESCARQGNQQFVLRILEIIFGEVLRIDRNKRLAAHALHKRLADIQQDWKMYELVPESYSYNDISTNLYLDETSRSRKPRSSLEGQLKVPFKLKDIHSHPHPMELAPYRPRQENPFLEILSGRTAPDLIYGSGKPAAQDYIRKHRDSFTSSLATYEPRRSNSGGQARQLADDMFGVRKGKSSIFSRSYKNATSKQRDLVADSLSSIGSRSPVQDSDSDSDSSLDSEEYVDVKEVIGKSERSSLPFLNGREGFNVVSEAYKQPSASLDNAVNQEAIMNTSPISTPYRVHWRCSCGHKDFDDFTETVPGAIAKLARFLHANGVQSYVEIHPSESRVFLLYHLHLLIRNAIVYHAKAAAIFFRNVSRPSTPRPYSSGSAEGPSPTNLSTTASGEKKGTRSTSNMGSHSSASESARIIVTQRQQPLPSSQNDHMLLCADEKGWLTTWEDLDVSPIKSDRELFDSFRFRIKRRKRWIYQLTSLKTIQRISFVKFALRQNQEVDQLQHDEIPPPTVTHYDFHERIPGHIPPIGNRFFMHRFSNSAHCGDSTYCLHQIPKRIRGRPQCGSAPDHFTAWGLYFHENFDIARLCLCSVVMVLISLVFGIVWAACKKSIQDGFTVASYILALEALTVGTVQVGIGLDWV